MHQRDPVAFYNLGAQLIPVLLLVIVIERRFFLPAPWPNRGMRTFDRLGMLIGMGLFGWAEYGAIHAVDVGLGSAWAHANVVSALVVEGFFITLIAIGWTPRSQRALGQSPFGNGPLLDRTSDDEDSGSSSEN
jgi:hypothetical protein